MIKRIASVGANKYYYRVALRNSGWRAIIDVHIYAQLSVSWDSGREWARFSIPLSAAGDRKFELPRLGRSEAREFRLFPAEVPDFKENPGLTESFRERIHGKLATVEEVLAMGDAAHLTLIVLRYDEFSGARRLFESDRYTGSSIQELPHSPTWRGEGVA